MANNLFNLQLLRNATVYTTHAAAKTAVEKKLSENTIVVGTPFIASWKEGDKSGVILAIKGVDANQIFDMDATQADVETKIQNAINALDVAVVGGSDSVKSTFIKNIKQEDGKIIAEAGVLTSSDKTVVLDDFDLKVNIDNKTIVKNNDGILSVDASATSVNGENAIVVTEEKNGETVTGKKVALKIKENEKVLSQTADGLTSTLTLAYENASFSGETKKAIILKGIDNAEITKIDASEFIKDGMLDNAKLITASNQDEGYTGSESLPYIKLTWNTDSGKDVMRFSVKGLVDVYTGDSGITISDNAISVKIDATSEGFLSVGADGVKLSGVQEAIDNARTEVKAANDDAHVEVTSTSGTNDQTIYTVTTKDVASDSATTNSLNAIKSAVGLSDALGHVTTTGNYTSGATTVAGEIAALDTQVKANADAIKANKIIAKDGSIKLEAITEGDNAGSTHISVQLGSPQEAEQETNVLAVKNGGLYLSNVLDCGTFLM